ncbi:1-(5-phosphoribosyl)-5-[(5-phosphoribosylamino)methylideneamino]imidazole-4-carboxamide isomerase [Hippea maritima]|uniref:1-(5-phosphoribosyl)-5-[(5-phosphoribosylamino)methylideneamino] imidazole-4-carboxamide isomerase n=1 Tax=Hippea maritima (strain ATCC 700847 / DSM 10411 / MH2) TaxID=760142 RepID=F2LTU6_HIPMA|nr:1-(5-phosphoribosyl)-5-[(5-phosphoribosylamino)methylideneamino]imidazole-4-carboxamide isomerase [Hippea maritima]AEA34472.1 1-(5-phosphoribosyl)-5-((5- phosphoribosylamino)methylideneamino) imidazole-4-carboxamide isomerase [Hippea maritima DSM 10411]
MIIIPAIDLIEGKAVRLTRGRKDNIKIYHENPLKLVEYFNNLGVKRIHVVDLDAAFSGGEKNNLKLIEDIVQKSNAMVEVGGGMRSVEDVEKVLSAGAAKIVIGTMPIKNPQEFDKVVELFKNRIIAGVDVDNGFVRISGWQEDSQIEYISFLLKMKDRGIKEVIITDISRDGTLSGVDEEFYREIAVRTDLDIIVSGGVRDIDDIKRVKELEKFGVIGVIVGKAIYEKTLSLEEAVELCNA